MSRCLTAVNLFFNAKQTLDWLVTQHALESCIWVYGDYIRLNLKYIINDFFYTVLSISVIIFMCFTELHEELLMVSIYYCVYRRLHSVLSHDNCSGSKGRSRRIFSNKCIILPIKRLKTFYISNKIFNPKGMIASSPHLSPPLRSHIRPVLYLIVPFFFFFFLRTVR